MFSKIKIALVGCGSAGQNHLKEIIKLKEFEICAVCDSNLLTAKQTANNFSIPLYYDNFSEMVDKTKLDALALVTPTDTHCSMIMKAAYNGLHAICEKPIANNYQEAIAAIKAMENANKILAITFTYRFVPEMIRMKEIIKSRLIGNVQEIRFLNYHPHVRPQAGSEEEKRMKWYYDPQKGNGMIYDCGVHSFDLFRWFSESEYKKVIAIGSSHIGYALPDAATIIIEFANGIKALYDSGIMVDKHDTNDYFFKIIISGDRGTVIWNYCSEKNTTGEWRSTLNVYHNNKHFEEKYPIYGKHRNEQYLEFLSSIKNNKLSGKFNTPEDAAKATELGLAVIKAMKDTIQSPSSRNYH